MALRPFESPTSIASRKASQALAEGLRCGPGSCSAAGWLRNCPPEPVGTSLTGSAGLESVITPLAGFAGGRRPQLPGGRIATPAAFR